MATYIRRPLAFLLPMTGLALAPGAGCVYHPRVGVTANGGENNLEFSRSESGSVTSPIAVGTPLELTVARYGAGTLHCTGLGGAVNSVRGAGVRIQGGSIDTEHCDPQLAEDASLVSAACDDASVCTVATDVRNPKSIAMNVTSGRPGTTRVAVSLKVGGDVIHDYITLRFEAPIRIRVGVDPRDLAATMNPTLPGISITPPRAWVVDATANELEIAEGSLSASTEGDAYVLRGDIATTEYQTFEATRPGHTKLHYTYGALPTRTLDVEVVDPASARTLVLYAPLPEVAMTGRVEKLDPDDFHADPDLASGRTAEIKAFVGSLLTMPARVLLKDGRMALAPLSAVGATPAGVLEASADLPRWNLITYADKPGTGTVQLHATSQATLSIPFTAALPKR